MKTARTIIEGMTMKQNEIWTFDDAAAATGYKPKSLRVYAFRGQFVEPVRKIGGAFLFDADRVRQWKRDRVKNRAAAGRPSPPDPRRKSNRK